MLPFVMVCNKVLFLYTTHAHPNPANVWVYVKLVQHTFCVTYDIHLHKNG